MLRALIPTLFTLVITTSLALAEPLPRPVGDVILAVSGTITQTNAADAAVFDLAMLRDLDATTIETTTIWTEGVQTFQGVSLHVLLARLGIDAGTLRATAIDDYTVEIPVSDAVPGGPIIAYGLNGNTMSIRDKGPLWIVYPYDAKADYRSEVVYSRSIWQLDRLEAID